MVQRKENEARRAVKSQYAEKRGDSTPNNTPVSALTVNIWGIAGRQEIMQMRKLWQLKIPQR